jgi:predicted outer membrane repeat protein
MGGALAISSGLNCTVTHCTFAENYAKFHGGAIQLAGAADAKLSLANSLFYNNLSKRDTGWAYFHINRVVDTDVGGNMQFLAPSNVIDSNSDFLVSANATRADAKLATLADNGGPTHTMAIANDSPARNKGVTGANLPATDQRGKPRDATPDIGAFEIAP